MGMTDQMHYLGLHEFPTQHCYGTPSWMYCYVLLCRNLITSKYLHIGCVDAAAPDFDKALLLSRLFFDESLRFLMCFCRYRTMGKRKLMCVSPKSKNFGSPTRDGGKLRGTQCINSKALVLVSH